MKFSTAALLAFVFSAVSADAADRPVTTYTIQLPEAAEIELALQAAPESLRAGATVYVFGTTGYRKVRTGANGFTCLVNRDGNQNGDHDLKPTCWDAEGSRTIVPVMLHVGELIARGASADTIKQDIDAGFLSGRFVSPQRTGVAYMLKGDLEFDPKTRAIISTYYPPHYMFYAPGVTNKDLGLEPDWYKHDHGRPWVYDGYSGGARTAYIIVPANPAASHRQ